MKSIALKRVGLIVLWAVSLMLVAQWGHTQTVQTSPVNPFNVPAGTVISGNDIAFRFQGLTRGVATGTWMVKVGTAWVPVGSPATLKPAGE